jgi:hypothetical protein
MTVAPTSAVLCATAVLLVSSSAAPIRTAHECLSQTRTGSDRRVSPAVPVA